MMLRLSVFVFLYVVFSLFIRWGCVVPSLSRPCSGLSLPRLFCLCVLCFVSWMSSLVFVVVLFCRQFTAASVFTLWTAHHGARLLSTFR